MDIKVLGCSGGIGPGNRTTSLLIDQDILIDAGSGVGDLTLEAMQAIRHVFITHSHLDHIAFLPMLVDSIFGQIRTPIQVHALPETLQALQQHIFNWIIWPDFSALPSKENPVIQFVPMHPGEQVTIGLRRVSMIPVEHTVPAVGYCIESPDGVFAFSGDTATNDSFWERLNALRALDLLIVEAGYNDAQEELGRLAKHYTPASLAADFRKLTHQPSVYISHLKPGLERVIEAEIRQALPDCPVQCLRGGERLLLQQ